MRISSQPVFAIYYLWNSGRVQYALLNLTILAVSVLAQLLPLLFGKPVLEAYRVVNEKKEKHQLFSPFTEQMLSRMVEVTIESHPSAILQVSALVQAVASDHSMGQAVISITVRVCNHSSFFTLRSYRITWTLIQRLVKTSHISMALFRIFFRSETQYLL